MGITYAQFFIMCGKVLYEASLAASFSVVSIMPPLPIDAKAAAIPSSSAGEKL